MRLFACILKVLVVAGLMMSSPAFAGAPRGLTAKAEAPAVRHTMADQASAAVDPCLNGHCPKEASRPDCPAGLGSCGPVFLVSFAAPLTFAAKPAERPFAEVPQLTVALMCDDPPPPRASVPSI